MLTDSDEALARAVLIHGPISRSALGRRLGLSPASLTRLAKPFLDRGIFIELDDASDGSVGRPVRPLDVAPDLGSFVGIKVTGDAVYAVATDVRAQILAERVDELARTDPGGRRRRRSPRSSPTSRRSRARRLVGVGVSIGGSRRDGLVESARRSSAGPTSTSAALLVAATGARRHGGERPRRARRGRALVRRWAAA